MQKAQSRDDFEKIVELEEDNCVGFSMLARISNSILNRCSPFPLCHTPCLSQVRYATKKAGGSTKNGRDSESKRLGPKKTDGNVVAKPKLLP
jgi:hypothetical protein